VLTRLDLRGRGADAIGSLPRPEVAGEGPVAAVRSIIGRVRDDGDAALVALTAEFDGVTLDSIRVPADELQAAHDRTPVAVRDALRFAADRIAAFHRHQLTEPVTWSEGGTVIRSFAKAVGRVGCYVPGGLAAYPSTLLMTAVPARVAGVAAIAVCVPPARDTGRVADVTLAAAVIAGVDEVYAVGGAQAIAALAYGTASIAPVDVICGPGNRYVAIAKQEVAGAVGVAAAFAGPSEIVVVADAGAPADFVAADLLVQAEHGPDGLAWLVCWSDDVADAVDAAVATQVAAAPRRAEIEATLASAGYAVICDGPDQALDVVNAIAPEHLQLMVADPEALTGGVDNAGAIFCGPWAPASLGDYVAGPSHVLPTHGTARFSSALTVADFVKHHHVVTVDRAGFDLLAPAVDAIATAEGLDAHAASVRIRQRR